MIMYMNVILMVLTTLVIILILYILINYFIEKSTQIATMSPAKTQSKILASELPEPSNTTNFTYSMWLNIDDWNFRYGQEKVVLNREATTTGVCPKIYLGEMNNTLNIKLNTFSNVNVEDTKEQHCQVNNIPLQKWTNVIVSLYQKTLDVYLDGKLIKTCVLSGPAKINADSDIVICPDGGFGGHISNFQYWSDSSNPQQAWNIYKGGFGGSLIGNFINKYRIKVALLENNQETTSFEI